jgi:hypothetical protein
MGKWYKYILILLLPVKLSAQDLTVKEEFPRVVAVGEQFTVMWTVNSGGGEFTAPQFDGFYKLMGPQTSYSSSTQIINGKMSQETSYSYVFYLQAMKEGKYVIAPATFMYKNKEYKSDSIYIEVIKGGSARQANQKADISDQTTTDEKVPASDLFIRLILDRNEVFLGEHITATVKLYSRIDLAGLTEVKFPAFNGFLKENLETPPLSSLRRENVNGTIYGTGIVQQFLLYPQITGEINIEHVEITALIQQKTGKSDPFFGDFFSTVQNIPKVIVSQPVKIIVKPLPGIKPADFSGLVGNIKIDASLNKDSVNVNDALNFRITVTGTGNLKLAGTPSMKLSPDIEVYDPKVTDNIKNSANGTTGQKTFEYVLIPRHYGEFTIPSLSYTYFNTATRQFDKLSTKEFHFFARKGSDQSSAVTVYGGVSKEEVKYLGKDIRFIKNSTENLKKSDKIILANRSFLSLYGFALILFLAVLFIRREHIRRNSDLSIVRNRRAAKIAGKRLQEASRCLKSGEIDKFHEEILKAIWGYLSDKLNIPVSELTRVNAFESLRQNEVDDQQIDNLSVILDKCEFARFAPTSSDTEASDIYTGAMNFIRSVENVNS